MLTGHAGVKYGLTVPKKDVKPLVKKNVFGFGEAEDSEDDRSAVAKQIKKQAQQKQTDKKVAQMQAEALAADPSIFDYDAHHDSIQTERGRALPSGPPERKSKYIQNLLDKNKEREREQDIIYERGLLKKRQAEDFLFGDKESFVTAAYKKKLEEDRKWQEEEKLREAVEAAQDVRKKGHMGDFYRNLLTRNVSMGASAPSSQPKAAGGAGDQPSQRLSAGHGVREASGSGAEPREPTGQAGQHDEDWEKMRKKREAYEAAQAAEGTPQEEPRSSNGNPAPDVPGRDGTPMAGVDVPRLSTTTADDGGEAAVPTEASQPQELSKEQKAAQARERFLARKRKLGSS